MGGWRCHVGNQDKSITCIYEAGRFVQGVEVYVRRTPKLITGQLDALGAIRTSIDVMQHDLYCDLDNNSTYRWNYRVIWVGFQKIYVHNSIVEPGGHARQDRLQYQDARAEKK